MAHTPTPWSIREGFAASLEIFPLDGNGDAGLGTANSEIAEVDDIYDEYADNAAFIVKACNAFEANEALIKELVEALTILREEADNFSVSGVYFNEECFHPRGLKLAKAALDKAEAR